MALVMSSEFMCHFRRRSSEPISSLVQNKNINKKPNYRYRIADRTASQQTI